jgi:hypothetical protein
MIAVAIIVITLPSLINLDIQTPAKTSKMLIEAWICKKIDQFVDMIPTKRVAFKVPKTLTYGQFFSEPHQSGSHFPNPI